ncbi:hypothetical protein TNCV_2678751 [Trichonephila clavipes]|nr:hypothetical protein TNCV_2678751 [Trichonephila clavipes]
MDNDQNKRQRAQRTELYKVPKVSKQNYVGAYATSSTVMSAQGPRNSSRLSARFLRLTLALALSTLQATVQFCLGSVPIFRENTLGVARGLLQLFSPSINLTKGLMARRLLRVLHVA